MSSSINGIGALDSEGKGGFVEEAYVMKARM